MTRTALPQRTPRVSDDQAADIVRLDLRRVTYSEIARRVGVHRNTVKSVLDRNRAALTINRDLEAERAAAVGVYHEVQRVAWDAIDDAVKNDRFPSAVLGHVLQAQARIDLLTGLEPPKGEDAIGLLAEFRARVLYTIRMEAPELAPTIARQLMAPSQPTTGEHDNEEEPGLGATK